MTRRLAVTATALVVAGLAVVVAVSRHAPGEALPGSLAAFDVPRLLEPERRFGHEDLAGEVALLNVWATWCVPCRQEHEVLLTIAREHGIPIFGLNYRDRRADALRWLAKLGDPYVITGFDGDGSAARALGVLGAPETYLLDARGQVVHRHVGVLTMDAWSASFAPRVARLRAKGTG